MSTETGHHGVRLRSIRIARTPRSPCTATLYFSHSSIHDTHVIARRHWTGLSAHLQSGEKCSSMTVIPHACVAPQRSVCLVFAGTTVLRSSSKGCRGSTKCLNAASASTIVHVHAVDLPAAALISNSEIVSSKFQAAWSQVGAATASAVRCITSAAMPPRADAQNSPKFSKKWSRVPTTKAALCAAAVRRNIGNGLRRDRQSKTLTAVSV